MIRYQHLTFLFAAALLASPLAADAHKWEIQEIFSNADGTVQFIEWFNADDDEDILSVESLSTSSGGFMSFPSDLPTTLTAGKRLLLATAAFAAIPGAPAPDYILPDGFLSPSGDTITYTGGDVVSFGALPTDGVTSITRTGTPITNSPTNFNDQTGSVRLALSGVRNGSGINPLCYSGDAPVLGTTWNGTIDASGFPGANVSVILSHKGPGSGIILPASGELLVDVTTPQLFVLAQISGGGLDVISNTVPNNLNFLGFTCSTQGLILGGGTFGFCNAVDLVLGH